MLAIETAGLTKDFGNGRGVFDLDLAVNAGEVFGFIGPNGAGKTTTIRLLLDLIRPGRGSARVFGLDSQRDALRVRASAGYLPGELPQYGGMRADEIVGLLAGLRGGADTKRIDELATRLELDLARPYRDLSHGNKQKVMLVQAFMGRPRLLILDEPTLGLDPVIQQEFRALIAEAVSNGATVFLSSHVLSEVERISDRIGIIRDGRLVRTGSLEELRAHRVHRVTVTCAQPVRISALLGVPGLDDIEVSDHEVRCSVRTPFAPLIDALRPLGIVEVDSQELSLEELFLADETHR